MILLVIHVHFIKETDKFLEQFFVRNTLLFSYFIRGNALCLKSDYLRS